MTDPTNTPRGASRFAASLPARLRLDGAEIPCSAHNLSRSGVLLIGALPRPEVAEVEVTIETPTGDIGLRVRARVAHFGESESPGEARLGVEFFELDETRTGNLELLIARVAEGMAPAALEGIEPDSPPERIRKALSLIPQAHRVALARRAQRSERSMLRLDPDGQVLEALARNPNLTVPEAIGLARMPHLLPTTLTVLAEDPRWISNEELRITVATHPRTPFATADRIVSQMSDLAVQRVLRRPGLNPGVREKLMTRLARKNRGA